MLEWQQELIKGIHGAKGGLEAYPLTAEERLLVDKEKSRFPALAPASYLSLIDWSDENDPIRRLLIPRTEETSSVGEIDTSGEMESTVARGLQHKYDPTAVLLMNQACAGHCRYCFRRRMMTKDAMTRESITDLNEAIAYIAAHTEIDNVLLSGGDPMISSTERLQRLFEALRPISHVRRVRISTKLPAFLPSRFFDDKLTRLLAQESRRFQIIFQCHFDHARELTETSREALRVLREAGCLLTGQIALMKDINAEPGTLVELFRRLHDSQVIPQYLFHPRPVKHATHFQIPILEGLTIVDNARRRCAGPEKRFRYVLTNEDGKIELVGTAKLNETRFLVVKWQQIRRGLEKRELTELLPIGKGETWISKGFASA